MFANDTEVLYSDKDLAIVKAKINQDWMNVNDWLIQNRMVPNVKKIKKNKKKQNKKPKQTKAMLIVSRPVVNNADTLEVHLNNENIDQVTFFDYLGVPTNNVLFREPHISRTCQRTYLRFKFLSFMFAFSPKVVLFRIYE